MNSKLILVRREVVKMVIKNIPTIVGSDADHVDLVDEADNLSKHKVY